MATTTSAQQPETEEDVIMKDASIISPDTPRTGRSDYPYDPMDISPAPSMIQHPHVSQTFGFATDRTSILHPAFSTLQPSQSSANLQGTGFFGPQTRSPFIRSQIRFSPKSRPPLLFPAPIPHTRVAQLQPHRKPDPFAIGMNFGLRYNSHPKPLFSAQTQRDSVTPSTRDSSFSSVDTQKSTEDGKVNSFDSSTSVSTTQSFQSRKRSIDEESNSATYLTTSDQSHLSYKYRRVSEEGLALSTNEPQDVFRNVNSDSNHVSKTLELPPSVGKLTPVQTTVSSPDRMPLHPLNTPDNDTQLINQVPGGWPLTPFQAGTNAMAQPSPTNHDANHSVTHAMMSGALFPPPSASPSISESPHNPEASSGLSEHQPDDTNTTNTNQPSTIPERSYWASWYDSIQKVYAMHHGVRQTVANAVRCAVSIADSCKQRALGLFARDRAPAPRPSSRRSPTRVNIRALPEEQQRRVREHQWRRDRGYPTIEDYPFPDLSFDIPQAPQPSPEARDEPNIQVDNDVSAIAAAPPSRAPKRDNQLRVSTHHARSSTAKIRKHKDSKSGIRKASRVDPVSPQLKRRMLMRPRVRDPERTRRELALLQVLRHGKLGALNEITDNKKATGPLTAPAAGPAQPSQDETKPKLTQKLKQRVRFKEPLVTEPGRDLPIVPDLAPHLHPSAKVERSDVKELLIEQKENIPPAPVVQETSQAVVPETDIDPWSKPAEFPLGRPVSAVSLFYPVSKPLPPGRVESIYADQWREIEEEEKRKQRPIRIRPEGPAVRPLPPKWEARICEAMSLPNNRQIATTLSGDPLTKKDLATCFIPMAWLNDEVINSYLALIIDYLRRAHGNAGRHDKPRFHAFNSFFFSNLRDKGYDSVRRWATRAKIGGENLLNVDTVFVPVHNSAHWTLIVVKPSERTIENFDSLGSLSPRHVAVVKSWLRGELGAKFVEDEWTILPSVSPQQDNGSDCGVFLLSTAKAVAVDIEPLSYGAKDTVLLRKKIVAELMNGGLEGDFDPTGENGQVLL